MWPGLVKLQEETAELSVELAKLSAYPEGPHPDGRGECIARVLVEMADVIAAIQFFCERNGVKVDWARVDEKVATFIDWDRADGMAGSAERSRVKAVPSEPLRAEAEHACELAASLDTANVFGVTENNGAVVVMMRVGGGHPMTADEALVLASWLMVAAKLAGKEYALEVARATARAIEAT